VAGWEWRHWWRRVFESGVMRAFEVPAGPRER